MVDNGLNELIEFLKPETRLDVKTLALHHVLSMTGDASARRMLVFNPQAVSNVVKLAFKSDEQKALNKDAFYTLINLAADEMCAKKLIELNPDLVKRLFNYVADENSAFADTACAILSNLSRGKQNSELIFNFLQLSNDDEDDERNDKNNNDQSTKAKISFKQLLKIFCTEDFNKTNKLDYLGPFICNLTQLDAVRDLILNDKIVLLRLLPYTTYLRSNIRRGGIVGSIKNCTFSYDKHEMLLYSPEIDLLSRLLLPLAGPEEFDEAEMEKLPDDLQYLPPDKDRESDPDIRIMLLETIMMLCSHKNCRLYIKEKNAYVILRELHKWEKDERVMTTLEKLIHLLIADEPDDEGLENFHKIVVPEDLSEKFYEFDQKVLDKNFN